MKFIEDFQVKGLLFFRLIVYSSYFRCTPTICCQGFEEFNKLLSEIKSKSNSASELLDRILGFVKWRGGIHWRLSCSKVFYFLSNCIQVLIFHVFWMILQLEME